MKKILIALVALLTVTSCSDMLEEHPKTLSEITFYNSPSEAHAAIIAMTAWLSNNQSWKGFNVYMQGGLSDMLYGRGSWATFSDYKKLTTTGQGYTSLLWKYLYSCIRDANYAIRQFPKATSMTEEEKQSYLAQAKFLRAFAYFGLVRYWAGVPLRTEENIGVDNVPRSSEEDIYDFILSDLDYAVKYIPESNTRGLPNRDAADYLLACVYMQLKQYDKALPLLQTIVKSNKYSLVSVKKANDFDNVFGPDAKETSEEVYYLKSEAGPKGGWMAPAYYAHPNAMVNGKKLQIPFDMRSVIPAICGHSFFKYFYGCKVNVLIRHLVNRPIFLLILLPQAVAGELEAQGFVDNSVQTCLCDELALEQAIVVSHRQLAAKY